MTEERSVLVDGQAYSVTISNEYKALQAAKAAGRAVVGLWEEGAEGSLGPADYVIEDMEDADEVFLERIVRRHLGLPWMIAETPRLLIRELCANDYPEVSQMWQERSCNEFDDWAVLAFSDETAFLAYIKNQYAFFEYGIWAIADKESGGLIGLAGLNAFDLPQINDSPQKNSFSDPSGEESEEAAIELGYLIFAPYRRRGYAGEACKAILAYACEHVTEHIYARMNAANQLSIHLAQTLGFCPDSKAQEDNGEAVHWYRFERYC